MNNPILLYSFADVDRSGKVRWTAAELGLEIEEARLQLGEHRSEPYLSLNPFAQIPTAVIDEESLIESTAICQILIQRSTQPGLIQQDNAQFWQLLHLFSSTLETPVVNYFLSLRGILAEEWTTLLGDDLNRKLNALVPMLPQKEYFCGEFSLVDICAAYVLRIALQAELVSFGDVDEYFSLLRARPAAKQSRFFESLDG